MTRTIFIVCIAAGSCFAQDSTQFDKLIPSHALKFAPLTLANFYPTLELSVEQKITKQVSAQISYGYVLNYKLNQDPEYQNKRGYKVKLEIRHYLMPSEKCNLVYYIAAGGYMNVVDFDRETAQQECYDLSCTNTFIRYYNYVVKYREHGFTLRFGFVKHFSKTFFMDVNGGWSLRFIDYDEPAMAGLNNFDDAGIFFGEIPNEEDRVGLMPVVGLSFGYRFR